MLIDLAETQDILSMGSKDHAVHNSAKLVAKKLLFKGPTQLRPRLSKPKIED